MAAIILQNYYFLEPAIIVPNSEAVRRFKNRTNPSNFSAELIETFPLFLKKKKEHVNFMVNHVSRGNSSDKCSSQRAQRR